ncbi:MAG: response regulator transcription factor [Acidobacteriota bacterium]
MTPTVLIVEDDRKISQLVAKHLTSAGFRAVEVHRGEDAEDAAERCAPVLVILDIGLPGVDGLEVLRRLRRRSDVPILMLTARSTETDKVLGFEVGADDYLTKPFGTRELVARVRALVRRAQAGEATEAPVTRGGLTIDPGRRTIEIDGERLEVTTLEFDVLHFLASRPGRVFSRQALMDQVWGEGRVVDDRSIDSLISRLRRKIEPEPSRPRYLQTVWGAGYRFADDAM